MKEKTDARAKAEGQTTLVSTDDSRGLLDRLRYAAELIAMEPHKARGPRLIFRDRAGEVQVVSIPCDGLIAGRGQPGFPGDDKKLSRRHFAIWADEGKFIIEDIQSRNGTRVNRARVRQRVLCEGDIIEAGLLVMVFLGGEDLMRFPGVGIAMGSVEK